MTGGDKRNYTTLWFITNEIKRNTRSFPYFDRQTWRRSPQSFEYLEELPAVGHKTASVVMSSIQVAALSCGYPYSQIDVSMEFDQRKNVKPKRCETAIPRRDME
jgi:hypothetical protein